MRILLRTACVLLPVLALAACSLNPMKAQKTVLEHTHHVAGSALEIKTHNGRVEVFAAPNQSDVSIEARITTRGRTQAEADERLAATTLSIERDADQRLVVMPVFPEPYKGGEGAGFVVMVPDAEGVNIDTGNGSVIVEGLGGQLTVDTSNGGISIRDHEGPAHLDTSNGSISITNHVGSMWMDTSNGRITLENVDGPITADTSNGRIEVSLAATQAGPLNLDTSNGSITVRVGPGFNGAVKLGTSNGSITVRDLAGRISDQTISRSRGRIVVGEGGEPSRLDTSNGRIRFTVEG